MTFFLGLSHREMAVQRWLLHRQWRHQPGVRPGVGRPDRRRRGLSENWDTESG